MVLTRPGLPRSLALAVPAVLALAWMGLLGFAWSDYDHEVAPAYAALMRGEIVEFLELSPAYGGSLLIRAPFAMLPAVWDGGEVAVFRLAAVPCLLSGLVLGAVLAADRARRLGWGWPCTVVLLLVAANPVTLRALEIGHPEELFGAVLSVAAVFAALRGKPVAAAVLLGLAIGNKAWAVLAIGPVLVALEERRAFVLVLAGAIAVAATLPFALATADPVPAGKALGTSTIFQPWQIWWLLGDPSAIVIGGDGKVKPDWRGAPGWLGPIPHPLIAALWVPLTLLYVRRRDGRRPAEDALLLLALLFLLRCVLDPWNIGYYHLPFLVSLVAWEALRFHRPPVLTLLSTIAVWFIFEKAPPLLATDVEFLVYMAWALPMVAVLARWSFARGPVERPLPSPAAVPAAVPS